MDLTDRVAHRLKLRDLRLLDTVVRWGSMAKAASQLNLSQPAVSKAIAEMEHVLGVRLIDRGRQGVEPTPHGAALLKRGVAIYDELRQGVAEIERLSAPGTGEVRIAASEPIAAGLLTVLIAQFLRKHPRASVHVTQTPVLSLSLLTPRYHDLRERKVDLVLGPIAGAEDDDDLSAEPLFDDVETVAVGAKNLWARRRSVALSDLTDEPWVLQPSDTRAGRAHREAFSVGGLDTPTKLITSHSFHLQLGLVATHQYFTILPGSTVHYAAGRFGIKGLPIKLKVVPFVVGIVMLKKRFISPTAQEFIQMAREVIKPLQR